MGVARRVSGPSLAQWLANSLVGDLLFFYTLVVVVVVVVVVVSMELKGRRGWQFSQAYTVRDAILHVVIIP